MEKKGFFEKLNKAIDSILSEFKEEDVKAVDAVETPIFTQYTLEDGSIIEIAGETIEVSAQINRVAEDLTTSPIEDGEFVIGDQVVTAKDGLVESVKPMEVPAETEEAPVEESKESKEVNKVNMSADDKDLKQILMKLDEIKQVAEKSIVKTLPIVPATEVNEIKRLLSNREIALGRK